MQVTRKRKRKNQISFTQILSKKPDLIWLLNPSYIKDGIISKEVIDSIKSKNIPIVLYGTLMTGINYKKANKDFWKNFDFFFCHHQEFTNYLEEINVNAHYMPVGFYPGQYYKKEISVEKIFPVSFSGSVQTTVKNVLNDKRVLYLKSLEELGLCVFGKHFKQRGFKNSREFTTHKEQLRIYNKTVINLDLPFINSPLPFYNNMYHLKNRFFEIPASHNFLLTIRCPEFLSIFPEDMIGYYDDNINSLVEQTQRYLKDSTIRKNMVEKSYKEVLQKHTFGHRFKELFKIINS